MTEIDIKISNMDAQQLAKGLVELYGWFKENYTGVMVLKMEELLENHDIMIKRVDDKIIELKNHRKEAIF